MVSREEAPQNLIGNWISAEQVDKFDDILLDQMLRAEHFPNGNALRVLRRLSYMFDMRKNPYDCSPQDDRRADWMNLRSGLVMKYKGRRHTRYFIDADEADTNTFIFTTVAKLAKRGHEFRFVVDSSFRPGSAPVSFQRAVLGNLRNGNPNWISKEPKLITRLSLVRDDFNPTDTLDASRFYIRKLTPDDAQEASALFQNYYPGNSFRPESIERYDTHFGAFLREEPNSDMMLSVLGVVGKYDVDLKNNLYHVVIPGDAVTHRIYQNQRLAPNVFTQVIQDTFAVNPTAILVADVNESALRMCRRLGFKGGKKKDQFYWYAFEVKGKTKGGED